MLDRSGSYLRLDLANSPHLLMRSKIGTPSYTQEPQRKWQSQDWYLLTQSSSLSAKRMRPWSLSKAIFISQNFRTGSDLEGQLVSLYPNKNTYYRITHLPASLCLKTSEALSSLDTIGDGSCHYEKVSFNLLEDWLPFSVCFSSSD